MDYFEIIRMILLVIIMSAEFICLSFFKQVRVQSALLKLQAVAFLLIDN